MGSLQQGKSLVVLNQQKRIEQNLLSVQAKVLSKQAGTLSSSAVATRKITIYCAYLRLILRFTFVFFPFS